MNTNEFFDKYYQGLGNDLYGMLDDLQQLDLQYLYKIFDLKEKLAECLTSLESGKNEVSDKETSDGSFKKSIDYINRKKEEVFGVFSQKLCCSDRNDQEFLDFLVKNASNKGMKIDWNKYAMSEKMLKVDESIRKEAAKIIFDSVEKKDLSYIFYGENIDPEYNDVDGKVFGNITPQIFDKIFVNDVFLIVNDIFNNEDLFKLLSNKLGKDKGTDIKLVLEGDTESVKLKFVERYKCMIVSIVNKYVANSDYDFNGYVDILNFTFLSMYSEGVILERLLVFLSMMTKMSNNSIHGLSGNLVSFIHESVESVCGSNNDIAEKIIKMLIVTAGENADGTDFNMNIDDIKKKCNMLNRIFNKILYPELTKGERNLLSVQDMDNLKDNIDNIYLKHEQVVLPKLKKEFFAKISQIYFNKMNKKLNLSKDEISLLKSDFVSECPDVKLSVFHKFFSANKFNEFKSKFIKNEANILIDKLKNDYNFDDLLGLGFGDLHFILSVYLSLFFDLCDDLKPKFYAHIEDALIDEVEILQRAVVEKKIEEKSTNEKFEQRKDKEEFFTVNLKSKNVLDVDLEGKLNVFFDGKLDKDLKKYLIRILKNKGGFYKKSWFIGYKIKDLDSFFEILDSNGFICFDPAIDVENVVEDATENVTENIGSGKFEGIRESQLHITQDFDDEKKFKDELFKLKNEAFNSIDLQKKVTCSIEILKKIGYTFENENTFSKALFSLFKGNKSVLKSFNKVLSACIDGSQLEEKKQKKWKGKAVYSIEVCGNDYRLVILDKGQNEKRCIYNIMSHNEYVDFLDKKCDKS